MLHVLFRPTGAHSIHVSTKRNIARVWLPSAYLASSLWQLVRQPASCVHVLVGCLCLFLLLATHKGLISVIVGCDITQVWDHLEELRERVLVAGLACVAAIGVCFCFSKVLIVESAHPGHMLVVC
jgi:hypothetical protein